MMSRIAMRSTVSRAGGVGCLLFVALFWSSITLVFDGFFAWGAFWQVRATQYSTALGTVTHSEVETSDGEDGPTYRPKISYTYSVAGKQYAADRYRYGQFSSGDRSAFRVVASHPAGRQVEVHYNPDDPSDAVLLTGLEGSDIFGPMFMLPFNLVMVGLWIVVGHGAFRRVFQSPAGGAKVLEDGRCVRVRLSRWKPLCTGAAVAGGLAFILIFIIAFSAGFNPPVPVTLAAWGLILGGGLIAWFYQHAKLARGDWDLVVDEFRQSLTLPRTFGRQEEVVVPVDKIASIEIERAEKRDSEGGVSRSFIPTLVVASDDGSTRREKLVEWRNEVSAQGSDQASVCQTPTPLGGRGQEERPHPP